MTKASSVGKYRINNFLIHLKKGYNNMELDEHFITDPKYAKVEQMND
jgi:hypothetical protein